MLKPEFQDSRVCKHCGAPAERLGEHWIDGNDVRQFRAFSIPGKHGLYTHVCIRNNGEDAHGKRDMSMFYACGTLRDCETRRVLPEDMPERCHTSEAPSSLHDIKAEYDRQKAAAHDTAVGSR